MTAQACAVLTDDGPDPDFARESREEDALSEAFRLEVETRARTSLADCGGAIPEHLRSAWFERFCMIAAIELADDGEEYDDVPY